jgi:hypothetical protein
MSRTSTHGEVVAEADLAVGAKAIARDCFYGQVSERQVYRLAAQGGWPFFKILNKLAGRPSAFRAEAARREAAAVQDAA